MPKKPPPRKSPEKARKPGMIESGLRDRLWSRDGSMQELGEAAGVDRSQIAKFRSGSRTLKLPAVDALLEAIGARVVWPKEKKPSQAKRGATRP